MSDEAWLEASSRLTSAVEFALEHAEMTQDEIRDIVEDAFPSKEPHIGGGPKRPKPQYGNAIQPKY